MFQQTHQMKLTEDKISNVMNTALFQQLFHSYSSWTVNPFSVYNQMTLVQFLNRLVSIVTLCYLELAIEGYDTVFPCNLLIQK